MYRKNYKPLVSVVIPVYNGANFIRSAIESALNQTYQNIEIIVVNDGSQDETDKIVKSYGRKVRYFKKTNGGVASALNLAIAKAKGEYISWLSHDDYYHNLKVKAQIEALKSEDLASKTIIYSDFIIKDLINHQSLFVGVNGSSEKHNDLITSLKLLFGSSIHGCTLLIPKIAFSQVGEFNTSLQTTQDYDLWLRMLRAGYLFKKTDQYLVTSRIHMKQDSRSKGDIHYKEKVNLYRQAIKMFAPELEAYGDTGDFIEILKRQSLPQLIPLLKKTMNKKYLFANLQVSDHDLVGNKFNGHDLHLYLREKQINSSQLVLYKDSNDPYTFVFPSMVLEGSNYRNTIHTLQTKYHLNGLLNPFSYE
jgi:glycosyltransferase involved in cell wall biosynthesis